MNLPVYKIDIQGLLSGMPDSTWFTHAQIFDDVLCVANKTTAAFVLKTTEGLILIDAIYPKVEMYHAIVEAIEDIGWDPREIKKFVITHGHFDHCGCGKLPSRNLSEQDRRQFLGNFPVLSRRPQHMERLRDHQLRR